MNQKNRKYIYPVIITHDMEEPHPFTVEIPDIDGMTEADSVSDALDMALDYIGEYSLDNDLPKSNLELPKRSGDEIVTLVQVYPDEYRRKHDHKLVSKNLTIPNYLNELGKENRINFSELLVKALKKELNV